MSIGDYLAFAAYLPKLLTPIQLLTLSLTSLQPAIKALKRVSEYFGKDIIDENLPDLMVKDGEIEFRNLSFKYGEEK